MFVVAVVGAPVAGNMVVYKCVAHRTNQTKSINHRRCVGPKGTHTRS